MLSCLFRSAFSWAVAAVLTFGARAQTVDPEDNWPHWRGLFANGTAPKGDPPTTWDAHTNIKWKAALPGSGTATPIVWGDQVFILAAVKTDRVPSPEELPKIDPKIKVKTDTSRRSPPCNRVT
jgi:outer membrane protein assembly factor BamB